MTKSDIIEYIASCAGVTKLKAERCIDCYHEAIEEGLKKDQRVTIRGFGTFSVEKRAARVGRNPQTGATIRIAAKRVPKFSPGKGLRGLIR